MLKSTRHQALDSTVRNLFIRLTLLVKHACTINYVVPIKKAVCAQAKASRGVTRSTLPLLGACEILRILSHSLKSPYFCSDFCTGSVVSLLDDTRMLRGSISSQRISKKSNPSIPCTLWKQVFQTSGTKLIGPGVQVNLGPSLENR